MVNFMLVVGC